jgi:hypothetical protein
MEICVFSDWWLALVNFQTRSIDEAGLEMPLQYAKGGCVLH